ncbi:type III secretion HpaP family protein [Endozoicomonas numazuensis]|uniref:Flagellar hook-length control protein-like C-terminal domain-containing protein n=1 Tax=Endozoicomonas numazuensis TaxID=1137799 RepID=A0A081NMV8_9GAMM|nr:type III secretion HpaP family protein [Endozoicomonas numazuensis]KEQ19781.1 hypothetical protein GZ78_07915 [Endozoicomonas numazuensis]
MQPTNQNQNVQQNTNNSQPTQNQSQKVSEDQASDFSKKMKKKEDPKSAKGESKDDQSLESLMAERRKSAKEALEGKFKDQGGGREGQKGQEEGAMKSLLEGNEQAIGQVRETQQAAEAQLKSIQAVSGPKEINEVINKLVDKIMVSSKDAIEGAEVRITLKDNILPGTEIRIQRVSGELQVTMNTSSADSHNFLVANEASLMKSLEKLGEKVQVNINMSGGGGDQNDGRSQQEYVGEEEQEDDDS